MAQIRISEQACIDIQECNGAYFADVTLFDQKQNIGPEYDYATLNERLFDVLNSFRTNSHIKKSQHLELEALQSCLLYFEMGDD